MKINIILFAGIVCCSSCVDYSGPWKLITAKGLKETGEDFNQMIFTSPSTGFLFGSHYTDSEMIYNNLENEDAEIYKTTDSGYSWRRTILGTGFFLDACVISNTIFAIKNVYVKTPYKGTIYDLTDSSVLYESFDSGVTWKIISLFPDLVTSIQFCNAQKGIVVYRKLIGPDQNFKVMLTLNGGKTWKEIISPLDLYSVILDKNEIYYTYDKGDLDKNYLGELNLMNKTQHSKLLPSGIDPGLFVYGQNHFLFAGKEKDTIFIYWRYQSGNFTKIPVIKDQNLGPSYLNVDGDIINLIVGEASTIATSNVLEASYDGGKHWVEETFPWPMFEILGNNYAPIAFYHQYGRIFAFEGHIMIKN